MNCPEVRTMILYFFFFIIILLSVFLKMMHTTENTKYTGFEFKLSYRLKQKNLLAC